MLVLLIERCNIVSGTTTVADLDKRPLGSFTLTAPFDGVVERHLAKAGAFADLPVFMKQAHEAGLSQGTKFVLPAAGWQHTGLKKEFMPEGVILGHNTLYFNDPKASPLQKEFVQWYADQYKDYPHWEADRAYFSLQVYKAGVEKAIAAKGGAWPNNQEIAAAMAGVEVMSLGGKGAMRADHIADQTFHQGLSTNKNNFDFPTLASVDTMYSTQIQKPAGADFWEWLKTADIKL